MDAKDIMRLEGKIDINKNKLKIISQSFKNLDIINPFLNTLITKDITNIKFKDDMCGDKKVWVNFEGGEFYCYECASVLREIILRDDSICNEFKRKMEGK